MPQIPASAATPTPGQIPRTDPKGQLGKDAFLRLLLAQMQHQDPLQPTDSAQMMTQLAQLGSVEQLQELSKGLTALQLGQDFTGAVALIGKNVTYRTDDGHEATGLVSAVKPGAGGAILTIGGSEVPSGNIVRVEA